MKDILTRTDVEMLVDKFYRKVIGDEIIGHFFNRVVNFSWEVHIPIMISFWESILLGTASYHGNPMIKHVELNKIFPLEKKDFERWLQLWEETVNENFVGPKAEEAVTRAGTIASLMQHKIGGGIND